MLVVSADIFVGWPQVIVEVMAHGFRWLGLAVEGFCIFFIKRSFSSIPKPFFNCVAGHL